MPQVSTAARLLRHLAGSITLPFLVPLVKRKILDGAAANRQVVLHLGIVVRVCPVGDVVGFRAAPVLNIARQGSDHHQVAAMFSRLILD